MADHTPDRPQHRRARRAFALLMLPALAVTTIACGGSDETAGGTSTAEAGQLTVTIDGEKFTCDEVIGGTCGPATRTVFARYGANIDAYVTSGRLGPFNRSRYEDRAFLGLLACVHARDGWETYAKAAQKEIDVSEAIELRPAWTEASRTLCSAAFPAAGSGRDQETP